MGWRETDDAEIAEGKEATQAIRKMFDASPNSGEIIGIMSLIAHASVASSANRIANLLRVIAEQGEHRLSPPPAWRCSKCGSDGPCSKKCRAPELCTCRPQLCWRCDP